MILIYKLKVKLIRIKFITIISFYVIYLKFKIILFFNFKKLFSYFFIKNIIQ